jgi:hypothetical protein
MARRILSVIKTETAYQINKNLVPIEIIKITFLTSSIIQEKIDYKQPWWFNENAHIPAQPFILLTVWSEALSLTIILMLVAAKADHI